METRQSFQLIYCNASLSSALGLPLVPNSLPVFKTMTRSMSSSAECFHTHDPSCLPLPQVSSIPNLSSFFPFFFQSAQHWAQCYSWGVASYPLMRCSVHNTKYDASFLWRSLCLPFDLLSPITSISITATTGKVFGFTSVPTQRAFTVRYCRRQD